MYHLCVKTISRASGRSATAAAAYRAGCEIADQRTGEIHDYTRKRGIEHTEMVLPPGAPRWATDRDQLWNAAEAAEKRKDARVAREYEVAIPKELTPEQGIELARDFAGALADRHRVAVDVAVHKDHPRTWDGTEKDFEGYHAHLLTSTRQLGADGFGVKTRELDDQKTGPEFVLLWRKAWEVTANRHLAMAGRAQRIDARSLQDQGIERDPTQHLGPSATALERRGIKTDLGEVNRRIEAAYQDGLKQRAQEQSGAAASAIVRETRIDLALSAREAAALPVPTSQPQIFTTHLPAASEAGMPYPPTQPSERESPMSGKKTLDRLFGIEGSERLPELAALDRMFGIEGARDGEGGTDKALREMRVGESATGEIAAEYVDREGQSQYLIETEQGEQLVVPKAADMDFDRGDEVEVTRTDSGYDIAGDYGYGR